MANQEATSSNGGAPEGAHDAWTDGMKPSDTRNMNIKEVREHDPSLTSIYTQGKLVHDGASGAPREAAPLEGNSLNDLLRWSIANSRDGDFESLADRRARGDFDPTAYRDYLDTILGEGDLSTMKKALARAFDETLGAEERVAGLEEVEYLAESIDNANDLLTVNGLQSVTSCLHSEVPGMAFAAAGVLATCLQNNAKFQEAALNEGLVDTLLAVIRERADEDPELVARLLYAISAAARTYRPSAAALVRAGGVPQLAVLVAHGELRVRRRALFLLAHVVGESPDVGPALRGAPGAADAVLGALCSSDDLDLQMHAVACVANSLDGHAVDPAAWAASRAWWHEAGAPDALLGWAQRLKERVAEGDIAQDEDPALPLAVARALQLLNATEPPRPAVEPAATAGTGPPGAGEGSELATVREEEPLRLTLQ